MFGGMGAGDFGALGAGAGGTAFALPAGINVINMLASANPANYAVSWLAISVGDATFATKTTAPDGTLTGAKLTASVANNNHTVYQNIAGTAASSATVYTFTVFAKAADLSRILVGYFDYDAGAGGPYGTAGVYYGFDLAGGQIAYGPTTFGAGFTTAGASADITSAGGGWYRCRVTATTTTNSTFRAAISLDSGTGTGVAANAFTGSGTNGVFLWNANIVPSAAWQLTSQTFFDDFTSLSTLDVNNTKASGFNWYPSNGWPNSSPYNEFNGVANPDAWLAVATPSSTTFSVANSVLSIATDVSSFAYTISTVAPTSAGYTGTVFGGIRLIEASVAFDPALSLTTDITFPTFWAIDLQFLLGTAPTNWIEHDVIEAYRGATTGTIAPDFGINAWNVTTGNLTATSNLGSISTGAVTWTNQNRFSELIIPATLNNGVGINQFYKNGLMFQEYKYSTSATSGFASGDNHTAPLILGAGHSWPINVDYVRVFSTVTSVQ